LVKDVFIIAEEVRAPHGAIILRDSDFHHDIQFAHLGIAKRETVAKVFSKGVLERTFNIRRILRSIDYMLRSGGRIEIEFYRDRFDSGGGHLRPLSYLMYEISLVFQSRISLVSKTFNNGVDSIVLEKKSSFFPLNDSVDSWSFGLVSNGESIQKLNTIIRQIEAFNIPKYEILICGPSEKLSSLRVKVLDDKDLYSDARIPISRKKNRIVDAAKYNNLLLIHDRISFDNNWYNEISKLDSNFDVLCMPILDDERRVYRVNDWIKAGDLYDYTVEGGLMDYSDFSTDLYLNGGVICIKRHIYLDIRIRPFLNWGEMEDVDFSRRLMMSGYDIGFYKNSILYSSTNRIKPSVGGRMFPYTIVDKMLKRYRRIKAKYLFNKAFNEFLLKDPFWNGRDR